jgi:hypothetical protein
MTATWSQVSQTLERGEKPAEKINEAQLCLWMLIRCNTKTVENGKCIQWVENALKGETYATASRAS